MKKQHILSAFLIVGLLISTATLVQADYLPSQVTANNSGSYFLCSLTGATVLQTGSTPSLASPPTGFYTNPSDYCFDEADWFINVGGEQDDTTRSRWIDYAGVAPAPVVATRSGGYVVADADTFTTGPACVSNQGAACTSAANSCGMTNAGTIQCAGTCSAVTPSNSLCPVGTPDLASTVAPVGNTATVGTAKSFTGGLISNIGTATGSNFTNIFQLVNSPTNPTGQVGSVVLTSPSPMTLGVGASSAVSASYTFASAGTYYGRFCANYNSAPALVIVPELNNDTANNCGPVTTITVSAAPAPDLTAGVGSAVTDPVNTPISLTALVKSDGTAAVTSNFHSLLEVCDKTDCSGSVSVTFPTNDIASLAVNATKAASASYTPTTTGTLYYQICANRLYTTWAASGAFTESNLNNNCGGWATLTVGSPITASCSVSPTSVQTGSPVTWTASASGGTGTLTYTWGGSVSGTGISVPETYASPGTYAGTVTVTDASGDTSGAVNCTAAGGGVPSGGANVTAYSCTPALSASPTTINAGGQTTLTWSENASCASSCIFSDGHSAGLSGTYQVTPPTPPSGNIDTYSVTCGAQSNTNQTNITVNVPTATISATPNRVPIGGTTALTWSSQNLTACTITRNGVSMGATFNTLSGASVNDPTPITTQTIYKFSCTGPQSSSASATAIVNVLPAFTEF